MAGGDGAPYHDSTELFSAGEWKLIPASLPSALYSPRATTLNNGVFLFGRVDININNLLDITSWIGGKPYGLDATDEILEFDISSEKWSQIGHMLIPRYIHAVSPIRFEDVSSYCEY